MRLFIAVDPSPDALAALAGVQRSLQQAIACRRWVDLSGAHLTLHFLGEVAVPAVSWRVTEVVLYRSHLGPQGPRFDVVARHPLGG